MGKLLHFPPPSPVEAPRPSYRRDIGSPQSVQPTFPIDRLCSDIMDEALQQVQDKQMTPPLRRTVSRLFNTNQSDSSKYFSTPSLSSEAKDLLRCENPHPGSADRKFFDVKTKLLDKRLSALDHYLRFGAKIASFSLLLSDALARCHDDPSAVNRENVREMFHFLDDCLGFCLREFSLVLPRPP